MDIKTCVNKYTSICTAPERNCASIRPPFTKITFQHLSSTMPTSLKLLMYSYNGLDCLNDNGINEGRIIMPFSGYVCNRQWNMPQMNPTGLPQKTAPFHHLISSGTNRPQLSLFTLIIHRKIF